MEWEQDSKILVGAGTVIILLFAILVIVFMIILKRRLNKKQHLLDNQERSSKIQIDQLKKRISELEEEVLKLKQGSGN